MSRMVKRMTIQEPNRMVDATALRSSGRTAAQYRPPASATGQRDKPDSGSADVGAKVFIPARLQLCPPAHS